MAYAKTTWANNQAPAISSGNLNKIENGLFNQDARITTAEGEIDNLQNGWNLANETWTYVSVDDPTGVIKINADVTTKYSLGMRIKFTNGGNVIYGIITAISYSSPNTTLTFLHEIDPTDSLAKYLMTNSAITNNYYSSMKVPYGFPIDSDKWSVIKTYTTAATQSNPTNTVLYNLGGRNIAVPIGCWNLSYNADCWATQGSSNRMDIGSCLSTTNNSCSDLALSARNIMASMTLNGANFSRTKIVTLSSKITYYLNFYVENATSPTNLGSDASRATVVLKAECAYL